MPTKLLFHLLLIIVVGSGGSGVLGSVLVGVAGVEVDALLQLHVQAGPLFLDSANGLASIFSDGRPIDL